MQFSPSVRVRGSAFFNAAVAAGLQAMSVYNRMYMPTSYGDAEGEYWALRNGVSMWDVGVERQVVLEGPDAGALAQYLSPRDLTNCRIGQGLYVPLCDHDGHVFNDPVLLKVDEQTYWLSIADSEVLLFAKAIAGERGLNVRVFEGDVCPLAVQGPKSDQVMQALYGETFPKLKYFGFARMDIGDIPLIVAKSGWSKQGGYELYLMDSQYGTQLWDLVATAGKDSGIRPGSPNSIERIESGLVSYGADTDDHTTPFELGLGRWCDLDRRDDFVGKAALKRYAENGPARRFTGFEIHGDSPASLHAKAPINCARQDCFVSAVAWSPRFQTTIGVGLVAADTPAGARVDVDFVDGRRQASVVDLPMDLPVRNSGPAR